MKGLIKKSFIAGLVFSLTILVVGISYASISSLSVTSGAPLTKALWDNLIDEIEPVAAKYEITSAQSISNGTNTVINYNNKVYDSHNAVSTGGAWTFTAPKDGLYRVSASMGASSYTWTDPNSSLWITVMKNGSIDRLLQSTYVYTTVLTSATTGGSTTINANSGDTISIGATIWRGGVGGTLSTNTQQNWVTIERIGDKVN